MDRHFESKGERSPQCLYGMEILFKRQSFSAPHGADVATWQNLHDWGAVCLNSAQIPGWDVNPVSGYGPDISIYSTNMSVLSQ